MTTAEVSTPSRLLVAYDDHCPLCVRCAQWLSAQETYVPVGFLPTSSPHAAEQLAGLPWLGEELVVVSDTYDVWVGPAAFLMCLWATKRWREWSWRMSGRALAPLAERFFHVVSSKRHRIGAMLGPPTCADGGCHQHEGPQ